jgi:hypothetical protein
VFGARSSALFGLVASLLAITGCGSGDPHAGVVPAIRHYVATSKCCVQMRKLAVDHVVFASDGWATADIRGTTLSGVDIGHAAVLLRRDHGRWRVLELGSALEGCHVPASVVRQLGLVPCEAK